MDDLLTLQNIISVGGALLGTASGWIFFYQERRKRKLGNKKTEVEILEKFQEIYKKMLDDVKEHLSYIKKEE